MAEAMTVPEIEEALRALAADLEVPDVDLVPAVADAPRPVLARRVAVVTAAIVIVLAALIVVVEPAREAVADWLGIGGTRIEVVDSTLGPGALPPVIERLGDPADAGGAAAHLGVAPLLPSVLDEPAVWLVGEPGVSALWSASDALPAVGDTGIGLVLTQRPESGDVAGVIKQAGPDAVVESTSVRGAFAVWIGGEHLRTPTGGEAAVADNVLLWVADGIEYRLESSLDLVAAREIAESVGGDRSPSS